jgi:DNA-binding winged helix-turn-helix (wHTH) protein/tetratricopeptide (TPR) repeat protein
LSATHRLLRFGMFELNLDTEELRKEGITLKLGPQPFKVLAMLAGRSGQIVTREEIRQAVWGEETYVDFEHGLNQCIKQIRTALNDNTSRPLYIETLPRKGYRFMAPVTSKTIAVTPKVTASTSGVQPRMTLPVARAADANPSAASAPGMTAQAVAPASQNRDFPGQAEITEEAASAEKAAPQPATRSRAGRLLRWLAVPVLAAIGIGFYWHSQKASALSDSDTIVLADFTNNTSDPVFDDTLKTALGVALHQSPFLFVLSDNQVTKTLKLMTRPPDAKLTPEVAREVCLRANSKAYVAGTIDKLGSQYVLELKAVNCQTGDPLAQEQVTADSKERVLNALGSGAAKLRGELGESLATVQKFDTPLEQATTSSLDALKAYTLGTEASRLKGFAAALPYTERAIQLDPNFATAYYQIASSYHNLGEDSRAAEYFIKAFELREHASERERLLISASYYHFTTGELEKAARIYQELIDDYPRHYHAYQGLSIVYGQLGQYDKATELARQAYLMPPERIGPDVNLINFLLASEQFGQAREIIQDQKRKLDIYFIHSALYGLSFLAGDSATMAQQVQWFASDPANANYGLSLESDTEAYAGHLAKARDLTRKAVEAAKASDSIEEGATWWENDALREAAFGNSGFAQETAAAGLKLKSNSRGVLVEAALAYAVSGNTAQAESIAQELDERYPLDTQMQSLLLPAIKAQVSLSRKNSAEAIDQLQRALPPIEYGTSPFSLQNTCLYLTYIRGQAYLQSGQGTQAAAEFQKILDHGGMVWNCWTGALAHLGVARANALEANTLQGSQANEAHTRALSAYKDFLTLWKDADPDIPIYKQAKAEYAKLAGTNTSN